MEPLKYRGLVVRTADWGDNDKMLTVLTGEEGVISVAAKGVKSLKNQNAAACNPLCLSEMVLTKKGAAYSLSRADVIESFYPLREDLYALSSGVYFASLAAMCAGTGRNSEEELSLILNTLYVLSKNPERADVLRAVFEMKTAELFGIAPVIAPCGCGRRAEFFDLERGECVCALHRGTYSLPLSGAAYGVLGYISGSDLKTALDFNTPEAVVCEVLAITEKYLEYHMGKLPRSLSYLKSLKGINE